MRFQPGQDVIVDFDGVEHRGEVLNHRGGHVLATIVTDLLADYGGISPMLAPHQTVCVAEGKVRPAEDSLENSQT